MNKLKMTLEFEIDGRPPHKVEFSTADPRAIFDNDGLYPVDLRIVSCMVDTLVDALRTHPSRFLRETTPE